MDVADLVRAGVVSRFWRLARSPALHFLALGAALAAADAAWTRLGGTGPREIVLSAADVGQLRRGHELQYGSRPSAAEERVLVDRAIDEEVLYRRALEIGLDRQNRVVRERLIAIMRMLTDDPKKDDEALYQDALALGLDRTDVVVRRHLVQLMSLLLKRSGATRTVTRADLERVLDRDADRYRLPGEVTLTQVYLDPARRGGALEVDAARLLADVRAGRVSPEAQPARGDPFLLGSRFSRRSEAEIGRLLGEAFAKAVAEAPAGEWVGPVRSAYGLHLVLVEKRSPGRLPSLEQVGNQLAGRVLEERGEEALRARLAELRRQYAVRIDRGEREPLATAAAGGGVVLAVERHARELGD